MSDRYVITTRPVRGGLRMTVMAKGVVYEKYTVNGKDLTECIESLAQRLSEKGEPE